MQFLLGIPDEALDAVMAAAFQLYQAGRYTETEVLCRGLIAADHKYWWSYSLYAATLAPARPLHRSARPSSRRALVYEPDEPKLLYMRSELREVIARDEDVARTDGFEPAAEETPMRHPRRLTESWLLIGKLLDPGAIVKDVVNRFLPKDMTVVGDVAGAVVDYDDRQLHRRRRNSRSRRFRICRRRLALQGGAANRPGNRPGPAEQGGPARPRAAAAPGSQADKPLDWADCSRHRKAVEIADRPPQQERRGWQRDVRQTRRHREGR